MSSSFYIDQKERLARDFQKKLARVSQFIASYFPDERGNELEEEFTRAFEERIQGIPYIGGKANPLTVELVQSAWALAIYDVLQRRGKDIDEIGMFVYKVRKALIASYPHWLLKLIGRYWFTKRFKDKRRKLALETQKREYRDNFVISFVEGIGDEFDFGFDDTECAILKYFCKEGVEELVPYLCASDIPMSRALGLGIRRTSTLALGGKRCDFRLKRGGETMCVATSFIHERDKAVGMIAHRHPRE